MRSQFGLRRNTIKFTGKTTKEAGLIENQVLVYLGKRATWIEKKVLCKGHFLTEVGEEYGKKCYEGDVKQGSGEAGCGVAVAGRADAGLHAVGRVGGASVLAVVDASHGSAAATIYVCCKMSGTLHYVRYIKVFLWEFFIFCFFFLHIFECKNEQIMGCDYYNQFIYYCLLLLPRGSIIPGKFLTDNKMSLEIIKQYCKNK